MGRPTRAQFKTWSPSHRARYRRRQSLKQTIAPGLTLGDANRQSKTAANIRYGAELRDLRGQVRASGTRQKDISNWYGQYAQDVQAASERQKAINNEANARVAQLMTGTQGADAQQAAQIQAQQQQQAQATGVPAQPNVLGAQASASRRNLQDVFGAQLATQGASQSSYLNDQQRIGSGAAVSAHTKESNRKANIRKALTDLKGEKGQYRQNYIENLKTAAQLSGFKQQNADLQKLKFKADRKDQRHQNMEDDRKYQLDQKKYGDAQAKDRYQKAHGLGPYKPAAKGKGQGLTQGEQTASTKTVRKIQNAVSEIKTLERQKTKDGKYPTSTQIRAILKEDGYERDEINSAYDLRVHGRLSRPNRRRLHKVKVQIPKDW